MIFPFRSPPGIPERIISTNDEPGIIAPFLGIADADTQSFELGFGLRFRRRCHPAERVDPMVEPGEKIFDHLLDRGLGRRREIFRDVNFAESVAEILVDIGNSALPPLELLRRSLQRLSIKTEPQIIVGLREVGGILANSVEDEPFFPGFERLAPDHGRYTVDRAGLPYDEHRLFLQAGGA